MDELDEVRSDPQWKQFQAEVAQVLRMSGYEVQQDVLLGHKKIDVLLSERRFNKPYKIAVECKYWKNATTQRKLTEIYANYLPLIPKAVDELLIVTRVPLTESAFAMKELSPHLHHATIAELHGSIFDFRPYLAHLISSYADDGLDRFYIPPVGTSGRDLAEIVEEWQCDGSDVPKPIAILGSYGLGKSTFARHIAWKYAIRAQSDPLARIPVLVRLGEISNEQSLEGLLGKLFTATNAVRNYSFGTFLELNRLGRFLVLFDGFDEMKQTLSWEEFKHNLRQLNRLVAGQAKVMILGRPTAFMTEAEQMLALHGERTIAKRITYDPTWPDYTEHEIAGFSDSQILKFIPLYIDYLATLVREGHQKERLTSLLKSDARQLIGDGPIWDIVRRPVQLKMVTELLPDLRSDLSKLTVHDLYDWFINYVIERESTKEARRRFNTTIRRQFAVEIAFWLWTGKKSERSLSTYAIPSVLVAKFCGPNDDPEAVCRDLVSACVLDRQGDRLFFPHRSFQEFLVAEAITTGGAKDRQIADYASALSPEVIAFVAGFVSKAFIERISGTLPSFRGSLPMTFVILLGKNGRYSEFHPTHPWTTLMIACQARDSRVALDDLEKNIEAIFRTTRSTSVALTLTLIAVFACQQSDKNGLIRASKLVGNCFKALANFAQQAERQGWDSTEAQTVPIVRAIAALKFSPGKNRQVDLSLCLPLLFQAARGFVFLSEWEVAIKEEKYAYDVGLPFRLGSWDHDALALVGQVVSSKANNVQY